jgi:hypothetical protein
VRKDVVQMPFSFVNILWNKDTSSGPKLLLVLVQIAP